MMQLKQRTAQQCCCKLSVSFDNSSLPADQKTEYTKHINAIKEHADAIVKSADVEAERITF